MTVIEYITKPQGPVLQAYAECRASRSFIMGPLGSGKTIQTINKIFDLMCEQEPVRDKSNPRYNTRLSRWVAVRNTYSELMTTTINDWRECHDDFGRYREPPKEPPNQILDFELTDGTRVYAQIYFIAFDRPDHVKKARGLQLTGAWINEIKELPKPVVDMLDLRIGRYPSRKEGVLPTWYGMVGDTNAPDDDHWYYKLAEEDKPEGWVFHRQPGGLIEVEDTWVLNPDAENLQNLPDGYYIRGMSGKSYDWISVNLANEYGYVADGKPVHPRYVDSVHCREKNYEPDPNVEIILGFDFGRTPACAMIQKSAMGAWECFDEFVAEDMSQITFAPALKSYLDEKYGHCKKGFKGWGDPSGGKGGEATDDTAHKIVRSAGLPCNPTQTNKSAIRRAAVENPLTTLSMDGTPRLMISPRCKKIRKGLKGGFCYRRIQVSGERYTDLPDKNEYSHPVEALEYALQGEGEGRPVMNSNQPQQPVYMPPPVPVMGAGARR